MGSYRLQHTIPASLVMLLAVVVTWLSFTQEPAEAYLFPRVVSVFFIVLAVWNLTRAVLGMAKVGRGFNQTELRNIAPGAVVLFLFVFFGAKQLGFYLASTLSFLSIYTLYDPAPITSLKDWAKRIGATVIFMAVIYGLFFKVLQVQTPRGIWF